MEYYLKALALWRAVLGEEHSDIAKCYWNIGMSYYTMCDYPNSVECFLKALRIREKLSEKDSLEVARICFALGKDYYLLGRYIEAFDFCTRAKRTYGSSIDVQTLSIMNAIIADSAAHMGL